MPDKLTNQDCLSKAAAEELDMRVVRLLESAPEIKIPSDFAARVARQVPAARPTSVTATHYGRSAVMISMIVTLIALIALTLHNGPHAAFGLMESLLLTEFVALTVWLSIRRYSAG